MQDKKLTCQQVQEYIDGLSQRQLQEKIESTPQYGHIQKCVACREYFNQAKSLAEKLDQWSVPNPKRNITAGVMAQIAQLERDRKTDHLSLWSRLPALFVHRLKVPVGVAAAVFVILSISLVLNVVRLYTFKVSKEKIQAKTDQTVPTGIRIAQRDIQKPYTSDIQPKVIQIQPGGTEAMCFFGISPEVAPTPIVIILGAPGVIPMEAPIRPVNVNLNNQSL